MRIGRKKTFVDRAQEYVEDLADTVRPQVEAALGTASGAAHEAADKARPVLADARDRVRDEAAPYAREARDRTRPMLLEGQARVAETAAAGATLAASKAAHGRELAAAKAAEARKEQQKGGKLKKILLLGGLAALGGLVFSKLRSQQSSSDNWQSSYVPTPPPAPVADAPGSSTDRLADPLSDPLTDGPVAADQADRTAAGGSDDPGGADPAEALTDSHEGPHGATTPDQPAEVVEIDDSPDADRR